MDCAAADTSAVSLLVWLLQERKGRTLDRAQLTPRRIRASRRGCPLVNQSCLSADRPVPGLRLREESDRFEKELNLPQRHGFWAHATRATQSPPHAPCPPSRASSGADIVGACGCFAPLCAGTPRTGATAPACEHSSPYPLRRGPRPEARRRRRGSPADPHGALSGPALRIPPAPLGQPRRRRRPLPRDLPPCPPPRRPLRSHPALSPLALLDRLEPGQEHLPLAQLSPRDPGPRPRARRRRTEPGLEPGRQRARPQRRQRE